MAEMYEESDIVWQNIIYYYSKFNEIKYVDPKFAASDNSLYIDKNNRIGPYKVIIWKRPYQIKTDVI